MKQWLQKSQSDNGLPKERILGIYKYNTSITSKVAGVGKSRWRFRCKIGEQFSKYQFVKVQNSRGLVHVKTYLI